MNGQKTLARRIAAGLCKALTLCLTALWALVCAFWLFLAATSVYFGEAGRAGPGTFALNVLLAAGLAALGW